MSTDVIIAGGGMVGLTLACALAEGGLRVAVVEPRTPEAVEPDAAFDLRVSAVNPASTALFRRLGAWTGMRERRCQPYGRMVVWDGVSRGGIEFDAAEVGAAQLGYIIENRVIQGALAERLSNGSDVEWYCPRRVVDFEVSAEAVHVELDNGDRLAAKLLVGADGPGSRVRQLAGIRFTLRDYAQGAVVATVRTEYDLEETAWQCFLPGGPLAFLPLGGEWASIVWSTGGEEAERLADMPKDLFRESLETAFESRLGRILEVGERACYPLRGGSARHAVQPRVALVGDAAHIIHPLAGQGANLGFADAAVLSETLLRTQRDPGAERVLRRYERARKLDVTLTLRAMEGFRYVFAGDAQPLTSLRGGGLRLANGWTLLKQRLMRYAMGLGGESGGSLSDYPS